MSQAAQRGYSHFSPYRELPHKTDLSTICQLLKQADALKLGTLGGEEPF